MSDHDAAPSSALALVEAFVQELERHHRLAPLTVRHYARDLQVLRMLAPFSGWEKVTSLQLQQLLGRQHGRGLSGRSLARMLSAWRGFWSYLQRRHGISHDPCAGLRAPKTPRLLPHALSPERAERLMAPLGSDWLAQRDHALLELFYSSGLRLAELARLKWGDLDRAQGLVRVWGKGAKVRLVPVGRKAWQALDDWNAALVARNGHAHGTEMALFVGQHGRPLQPRSIEQRVSLRARQLGLDDRVHPHVLRHSFASHLLQSSGDLRAVQEMMGHASIVSTQVYTHLDFQHLARAYDKTHPRARRK